MPGEGSKEILQRHATPLTLSSGSGLASFKDFTSYATTPNLEDLSLIHYRFFCACRVPLDPLRRNSSTFQFRSLPTSYDLLLALSLNSTKTASSEF